MIGRLFPFSSSVDFPSESPSLPPPPPDRGNDGRHHTDGIRRFREEGERPPSIQALNSPTCHFPRNTSLTFDVSHFDLFQAVLKKFSGDFRGESHSFGHMEEEWKRGEDRLAAFGKIRSIPPSSASYSISRAILILPLTSVSRGQNGLKSKRKN